MVYGSATQLVLLANHWSLTCVIFIVSFEFHELIATKTALTSAAKLTDSNLTIFNLNFLPCVRTQPKLTQKIKINIWIKPDSVTQRSRLVLAALVLAGCCCWVSFGWTSELDDRLS